MIKLSSIKPNPDNPRIIKDDKFQKLVQSIKDFPQMLELRPIVGIHGSPGRMDKESVRSDRRTEKRIHYQR